MSFDKSKLITKKAIAVYVALAVIIASAFGAEDTVCKLASLVDENACAVLSND